MFLTFSYLGAAVLCSYSIWKVNEPKSRKLKKLYKHNMETYLRTKKVCTYFEKYPKYEIELTDLGVKVTLDISGICSVKDIEKDLDYIQALFRAEKVNMSYIDGEVILNIQVLENLEFLDLPQIIMDPREILVGYDYENNPIKVSMKNCPHLMITGLSGQGKTGLLRGIIKSLKSDVILCNGFKEDYEGVEVTHLLGEENILKLITSLLEGKEVLKRPLYIILEELGMIQDKKLIKAITELLMYGRHYNIYCIGIIQVSKSNDVPFKTLFNSRLTFRQVDCSSYQVILGTVPKDERLLNKREFYLITDGLYKGKTYTA